MEQDKYVQNSNILDFLKRNFMQNPSKEEKFVEKEEYLNQYRENNFWAMHQMTKVESFFNNISYQGVNEEIKEKQCYARKKILRTIIDNINYRRFNDFDLHTFDCIKLEEKHVTTMLQSNIDEIPI